MTSWGNYLMRNVRHLYSSQHMCGIVSMLSTTIKIPLGKFIFNFKQQNTMHLAMEGLNIVAFITLCYEITSPLKWSKIMRTSTFKKLNRYRKKENVFIKQRFLEFIPEDDLRSEPGPFWVIRSFSALQKLKTKHVHGCLYGKSLVISIKCD
jgi:hypothetical protein